MNEQKRYVVMEGRRKIIVEEYASVYLVKVKTLFCISDS